MNDHRQSTQSASNFELESPASAWASTRAPEGTPMAIAPASSC